MHFIYTLILTIPLLGATVTYGDLLDLVRMEPIEPEVVSAYLTNLAITNKLGHFVHHNENYDNYGYNVQVKLNVKEIGLPWICTGQVFASVNRSADEEQDYDYSLFDIFEDGFLIDMYNLKCGPDIPFIDVSVTQNVTFVWQNKFPYLFVHHSLRSSPISELLSYEAYVEQKAVNEGEEHPESYNTTVTIESLSEVYDWLKFNLNQTISNQDSINGYEIAKLFNPELAVLVQSFWNGDEFFKQLSFLNVLNLTYSNILKEENIMFTVNLTKSLFGDGGFNKLVSGSYRDEL